MNDVEGCLACDLSRGRRPLPGGQIHRTRHWIVEHCVGPLGVGTLVVKPERHVVGLADLQDGEAAELGSLLRDAAQVVTRLCHPREVYVCLWSHGPVHIHFVVQPVNTAVIDAYGAHGPNLQVAMFDGDELPLETDVLTFAAKARDEFTRT
jgi:diadenosine tetraphosphate (Ap4A) HIT family hydrolase